MVVPIYLLACIHSFELLGWQELGQAMGAHSVVWIRSYDCWSSDLAAQMLLWFNLQRHHVPSEMEVFVYKYDYPRTAGFNERLAPASGLSTHVSGGSSRLIHPSNPLSSCSTGYSRQWEGGLVLLHGC